MRTPKDLDGSIILCVGGGKDPLVDRIEESGIENRSVGNQLWTGRFGAYAVSYSRIFPSVKAVRQIRLELDAENGLCVCECPESRCFTCVKDDQC